MKGLNSNFHMQLLYVLFGKLIFKSIMQHWSQIDLCLISFSKHL